MSKSEKLNLLSAHISKGLCERILTLIAVETAAVEASDTESEDNDVSKGYESEGEVLFEFGNASSSDENESKDSEAEKEEEEEEEELPVGDRVNRYGRRVGNWRLRYSN